MTVTRTDRSTFSPDVSAPLVWLRGGLVCADSAAVSPFDHGLLTGDGVFETLVAYRGRPFAADRHHARLVRSAEGMGLTVPEDEEGLHRILLEVIGANDFAESLRCRLRVTLTGGEAPLGSARGASPPTLLVAVSEAPDYPVVTEVITVPFTRNERSALVGLKTTSYGENVVALRSAKERGCSEALFRNTRGELCEGSGSNLFLVEGEKVFTPPLSSGCLAGVTRAIVMECAAERGLAVEERTMKDEAFDSCDGAFLTSTLREIQTIRRVDGREIPIAERIVTMLRESFEERKRRASRRDGRENST